ncbi:hypothetical protein VE03_04804 [Pseudogymnoascus sp. 23342-1-I1]|nr:hypothetical protein VE03_04804 [Pseudogymnoascus sp. 23342-1-I1]
MADILSSSPDPLNDTPTYSSPSKSIRQSRARRSQQMYSSSPTKQTFELDVGNDLSPQKIRVTVEAENNKENSYPEFSDLRSPSPSPYYASSRRPNTRTTTTTVPLKGLSDSEEDSPAAPPKRGRGRPRKSIGTPVPSKPKTRNLTPAGKSPRRRRTLGSLVDGDDEEDWDFAIGKSVEVGRGKGRSRSRSVKSATRKTPAAKSTGPSSDLPDSSAATKRGGRQSLLPEEIPILEDLTGNSSPADESFEEVQADDSMPLRPAEQNTIGSHSEYSTIRSTSTGFGEDVTVAQFDLERTPEAEGWSSPRVVSAVPSYLRDRTRRSSPLVRQTVEEVPRSSLSANEIGSRDDRSQHEEENYDDEAEDGLGDLQEFDTILESEGFSMISVDSVPSLREHFSSPSIQSKPVESVSSEEREVDFRGSEDTSALSYLSEASSSKRRSFDNVRTAQHNSIDVSASDSSARAQPMTISSPRDQDDEADASEHLQEGSSVAGSALLFPPVEATTTSINDPEHPATPWLPTPEETPSPDNDSAGASAQETSQGKTASVSNRESVHHESTADSSINMPQMRSSPPSFAAPRYTYTAHLRQRKSLGLIETPSIVFSSPSLPPPKQRPAPREQLPSTAEVNGAPKPHLSSSVLAGRALQDIVVLNSSSTHSSFLRSPFKSPNARRHPLSPTEEPTKEPVAQSSKLDSSVPGLGPMSWRNLSRSRTLSGAAEEARKPGFMKNIPLIVDDPFLAEASEQLRSPSPEEKDDYSLGLPTPGQARNPQIANLLTHDTNTVRYSDEMSWQVDSPAMRTPPRDDNEASGSNKSTAGSSRAADRQMESEKQKQKATWLDDKAETTQHLGLDLTQVYVVPSDLPTINSTPLATKPQPTLKAAVAEVVFDNEDIWLAEARNNSSPSIGNPADIAPKQASLERPRRSKLPSPWRQNSRRLVYSDELAAQDSSFVNRNEKSALAPSIEARNVELPTPAPFAPRATLLPKDNTKPSVLDRLAQSQLAPKAVLLPKSAPKAPEIPSGAPQLGALRRSIELPKPQPKPFMAAERPQVLPVTEDYDVSEMSTAWDIPQKQNFKPRITPRQSNILGISALLASSPVKKPEPSFMSSHSSEDETVPSPTQSMPAAEINNASHQAEEEDYTQESSSQFVSDEEDQTMEEYTSEHDHTRSPSALSNLSHLSRTSSLEESSRLSTTPARPPSPRPTPASPLKSCLRLSTSAPSPIKAVVFSATTAASPSVVTAPRFMENSEWAKTHWLKLRAIYWDYKKNPTPLSEIPASVRESEYAGKTVWGRESDGSDSMVMEVWMVDVVHMFLDEAEEEGGLWDEAFVCKRLYGLVGMERKREREREAKEAEARKVVEEEAGKRKGVLGLGMGWL